MLLGGSKRHCRLWQGMQGRAGFSVIFTVCSPIRPTLAGEVGPYSATVGVSSAPERWEKPVSMPTTPAALTSFSATRVMLCRSAERHRSEEHTSELQSRGQLVCRLLLEKKNRQTY